MAVDITQKQLEDLLDEIKYLKAEKEEEARIERNVRQQSQAEKEYELFHKRKALVEKHTAEFKAEYEAKVEAAVDAELALENEPAKKKAAEDKKKLSELEAQAKALMEKEVKSKNKRVVKKPDK